MIRGFVHAKFENSAIYFTKDQADYLDSSNAFWLSTDSTTNSKIKMADFDEHYVLVVDTFYADQHGHMGNFVGTLKVENISKSKRWYK